MFCELSTAFNANPIPIILAACSCFRPQRFFMYYTITTDARKPHSSHSSFCFMQFPDVLYYRRPQNPTSSTDSSFYFMYSTTTDPQTLLILLIQACTSCNSPEFSDAGIRKDVNAKGVACSRLEASGPLGLLRFRI